MGIHISSLYKHTAIEGTGKLDVGEYELQLFDSRYMLKGEEEEKWSGWLKPSCIPITIILVLIVLVVLLPLLDQKGDFSGNDVITDDGYNPRWKNCSNPCVLTLVESIPENLTYPNGSPSHLSIYKGWQQLIKSAEKTIEIASFYWTLKGSDVVPDPSAWQGEDIFQELLKAGVDRKVKIKVAQNQPKKSQPNYDTEELQKKGAARIRNVNFYKLFGAGVLHTKLWLIDGKHFFIGSANMDWRSLTQVKELGVIGYNCSCLVADIYKIFEVYWLMGLPDAHVPQNWPPSTYTTINKDNPVTIEVNGSQSTVYISSSPPPFCPKGRTSDIDSILDVIHKAQKFVYIAVMDYFPLSLYTKTSQYWPQIDDALREVAVDKGVKVHLLASHWNHTRPSMVYFLKSLAALNNSHFSIEAKLFVVPTYTEEQEHIPFARVNHNKYMVTDQTAYIGTSNWSEDYFTNTGGVGFIVSPKDNVNNTIRDQLQSVFERDWNSPYAHTLSEFLPS